jgi:uncharacterized repeat protein (TIGR01451 family)
MNQTTTKSSVASNVLLGMIVAAAMIFSSHRAEAVQLPANCSANNLSYNINNLYGLVNVTNGTVVTFVTSISQPTAPTTCNIVVSNLVFFCSDATGNPTVAQLPVLIAGPNAVLPPGFSQRFTNQCAINVNPGVPTAVVKVADSGAMVQDNPLQNDGAAIVKTLSVNIFSPCIHVTKQCNGGPFGYGQPISFVGTVTNCGDVVLGNVTVVDDQAGTLISGLVLQPGQGTNFTANYNPSGNLCGPFTNNVTATGLAPLTIPATVSSTASAVCTVISSACINVTKTCPTNIVYGTTSYVVGGVVTNCGNGTLVGVTVVDDNGTPGNPADDIMINIGSLAVGGSAAYSATNTVPVNCGPFTDTVVATGNGPCGGTVSSTNNCTTQVITAPAIAVTLACPAVSASTGGLITYTGTVRNSGNVTLNNVTVVNSKSVPSTVLTVPSLAPGISTNFTASFTAPTDACSVSSMVTVTGSDNCTQFMVTNTASSPNCPLITAPGIKVTKSCLERPVSPDQLLTFSGSVSNTGNVTLTNIVVVNSQPAANTPVIGPITLAPGAGTNFTASYVAPTNCSVTDTLTATGRSICGVAVTNTVTATCPIPTPSAIVVTQSCPPNPVVQGGLLTFSGTVRNAGNITLSNIVVVNNWPVSNIVIFTAASLAPGATLNFTASYVVPANCCGPLIELKASGQGCDGVTVTDTDSGHCTVSTSPQIVVTKVCAPGVFTNGALLTYSGTVSNAGNIYLYNVTVVDNQPVPGSLLLSISALAPGQSKSYTGSYIVPPDFCGKDTVTARGFNLCGGAPVVNSASATCPIAPYSPRIAVSKQCPPQPTAHGGTLTFSGTVSNLGNVTLVNVFVVNNQPSNNTPVIGPITLAPGEFFPFTGSYTAPLVCCDITDTLTASGQDRCSGSNVTATAMAICPLLYTPGIALVQNNCPPNPGSMYPVSGFVTNTGDALLANVVVTYSSRAGQNLPLLGPIDLQPGQSEQYFVPFNTYAITVTATGQETCSGSDVTATVSCPVATTPGITITEDCPPGQVTNGSSVDFGGLVCNTGNITLTNIFVFSSQSGNNLVLGPITLLPGACQSFAGSYIATGGSNPTTNSYIVTNINGAITTNIVVSFTPANTVTATGWDIGQAQTVAFAANCLGPVTPAPLVPVIGTPTIIGAGYFSLSFPTENGKWYFVQYKNTLTDPAWTDLGPAVAGTGWPLMIYDPTAAHQPSRFYRIIGMP